MTDFVPINAADREPDDPITANLMSALDLNPIAMFEGAPGAPRLQFAALGTLVAGAVIRSRNDAVQSTASALSAMLFGFAQPGIIRLSAEQQHGGVTTASVSMVFSRWRVNSLTNLVTYTIPDGTLWTARTLDVSVIPGDTIGVYINGGGGGAISQVRNIRLSTDGGLLWPFPTFTPLE